MKYNSIIIFIICIISSSIFSQNSILKKNMVILDSLSYNNSYTDFWRPDTSQTNLAIDKIYKFISEYYEYDLNGLIPNYNKNKDNEWYIKYIESGLIHISENTSKYKVQFIGVYVNGEKRIFCNFFPDNNDFETWKKSVVFVFGGGASFWQIEYDIKTSKLFNFRINGPR